MISLATFSTTTRVSPEGGEASLTTGATGSFSALLAQHNPEQAAGAGLDLSTGLPDIAKDTLASAIALAPVLSGIALPEAAESGKDLPVALPVTSGQPEIEAEAEAEPEAGIDIEALEAAALATIVPQATPPVMTASGEAGESVDAPGATPARPVTPQVAMAAQVAVRPDGETQKPTSDKTHGAQRDMAVALHVAPAASPASNTAADDAMTGSDAGNAPAARHEMTLATAARPVQPEQIVPATPVQPAAVNAAPGSEPTGQAPRIETLQELTRIVDRLAAAREVFAPAAEALAIEHSEFGELSLRFDQRRDGGLSVQLSASNPETQRAVAQAVSAQSFHSAADDRAGAGQPQNQPQGSASRSSADREGTSGNGNAARHDQPAPQQQRQSARQQPGGGKPRSGVFA